GAILLELQSPCARQPLQVGPSRELPNSRFWQPNSHGRLAGRPAQTPRRGGAPQRPRAPKVSRPERRHPPERFPQIASPLGPPLRTTSVLPLRRASRPGPRRTGRQAGIAPNRRWSLPREDTSPMLQEGWSLRLLSRFRKTEPTR